MNYTYDKEYMTLFPRMYSRDNDHVDVYIRWSGLKERDLYEPRKDARGNTMRDRNGQIMYNRAVPKESPTFFHNMKFLFKYQIGHMYPLE